MSQILHNFLPKDIVRLCQSFLLPSIFHSYTAKIEVGEEIRQMALDFKRENDIYDFYMNYYRGDIYTSTLFLNSSDL